MGVLTLALALILAPAKPVADLPFEVTGHRLYVPGTLAGRPSSVILDTGAGATVVDLDLARELKAERIGDIPVGGSGSATQTGWRLQNFPIEINGTTLKHPIPVAVSLGALAPFEGRRLEVILGTDFFRSYVVDFDYAAQRARLWSPDGFVAPKVKAHPFELRGNVPVVQGSVEIPGLGTKAVWMMLDTGATTGLTLTRRFNDQEKVFDLFPNAPSTPSAFGVGGGSSSRRVRISALTIGGVRLEKPIAELSEATGGATGPRSNYDALIGGETLKRFRLILDYPNKLAYFVPNRRVREPYVGDRVGASFVAAGDRLDRIRVFRVLPNTPASEAGLAAGAEVESVNGKPVASWSLDRFRREIRESRREIRLVVRIEGGAKTIVIKPRALV